MSLSDFASFATIGAFFATVVSIAFSAKRYLGIRDKELSSERFIIYHRLLKSISTGHDQEGRLKEVSQIAYIYELRNFPEYGELTSKSLIQLSKEWQTNNPSANHSALNFAIDDTVYYLAKNKT